MYLLVITQRTSLSLLKLVSVRLQVSGTPCAQSHSVCRLLPLLSRHTAQRPCGVAYLILPAVHPSCGPAGTPCMLLHDWVVVAHEQQCRLSRTLHNFGSSANARVFSTYQVFNCSCLTGLHCCAGRDIHLESFSVGNGASGKDVVWLT